MNGATAVFSYQGWLKVYPEFEGVGEPQANGFFSRATMFLRNDGTGPVSDAGVQLTLLNLLTSHIATLSIQAQGDPSPGSPKDPNSPVGRVNSANQGSVSVQFENEHPAGTPQWYQQTKYGAEYWAATASYRRFRFRRGPSTDPSRAGLRTGFLSR